LRELTDQELDKVSEIAVEAIENYILSRVSKKEILDLDINADITYQDALDIDITVDIDLDELSAVDEKELVENAVEAALNELDVFIDENFR
jgi:divalent metal cation (Fe/Co/Zn/Cd) transporter